MPYERLRAADVAQTAARLQRRIEARFPGRNLARVAARLVTVVEQVEADAESTRRMHWLRVACVVLIGLLVLLTVVSMAAVVAELLGEPSSALQWMGAVETGINDAVFAGFAVIFLWLLPAQLERRRILGSLHRLRSLAHVIDMHQLTKDPERYSSDFAPTPESVPVDLSPAQMANYLDYCSELLSLVGKAAALFAERSTDTAVLSTISDIENLTNGMARKIWQKLALLRRGPDGQESAG